jgi:hypothetical protein
MDDIIGSAKEYEGDISQVEHHPPFLVSVSRQPLSWADLEHR